MTKTRLPWWLQVTCVFLLGRAISTVMLLVLASQQAENAWTGAQPSLWDFSTMWDGRWYNIIAEVGYPHEIPYTEDGHVAARVEPNGRVPRVDDGVVLDDDGDVPGRGREASVGGDGAERDAPI